MKEAPIKSDKQGEKNNNGKRKVNNLMRSMTSVSILPLFLLGSSIGIVFKILVIFAYLISNFWIADKYKEGTDEGKLVRPMMLVNFIFILIIVFGKLSIPSFILLFLVGCLNLWNSSVYQRECIANKEIIDNN